MARRFVLVLLLVLIGGGVGCGVGLVSGLTWVEVMGTSCFEGYCGYVVGFHALLGLVAGVVAGGWWGARIGARSAH